jgi:hypothetical protein
MQQAAAPMKHGVLPPSAVPPLLLLPPPLLLPPSVPPPSPVFEAAGLLLELQATAKATAAAPDTDHKIIEFFILKTSLLSLGETQAALSLDRFLSLNRPSGPKNAESMKPGGIHGRRR